MRRCLSHCPTCFGWVLLVWLGLLLSPLCAAELLEPPFGLKWGDTPEKLLDWAARQRLDAAIRLPGDDPALRVVRVEPRQGCLSGTQATALEARFLRGRMVECTIEYADPEAGANVMEARFEDMKRQLAQQYGKLAANQQQRVVEDQFATRTQAYHREAVRGLFLLLAATEIEDLLRKTREFRFSVVFRNENLRTGLLNEGRP